MGRVKAARMGHMASKTQPKKQKDCECGGRMDWVRYLGEGDKGMRFWCEKCGVVNRA